MHLFTRNSLINLVCAEHKEHLCMECAYLNSCGRMNGSQYQWDPDDSICDLVRISEIPAFIENKTEFSLQRNLSKG